MTVVARTGGRAIWIKDRVNGSFSRLTTDGAHRAVWTPDGRQIAFLNIAAGSGGIRVQPWDGSRVSEILSDLCQGPAGRIQVSVYGGDEPVWAPTGRELFFRSPTHVMAALITEGPELEVLRRDTLFQDTYVRDTFSGGYDVFPSGNEFVFLENLRSQNAAFLGIANWPAHLQQRMRAR